MYDIYIHMYDIYIHIHKYTYIYIYIHTHIYIYICIPSHTSVVVAKGSNRGIQRFRLSACLFNISDSHKLSNVTVGLVFFPLPLPPAFPHSLPSSFSAPKWVARGTKSGSSVPKIESDTWPPVRAFIERNTAERSCLSSVSIPRSIRAVFFF